MELEDANLMLLTACLIPEIKMDNCAWDDGWSLSWSSYHVVTAGHVGATMLVWNEAIHYRLQSHWEDVSHTEVRSYKSPTHFTQCFHPTVKMQPFSLGVTGAERGPHLAASLQRSIVEP